MSLRPPPDALHDMPFVIAGDWKRIEWSGRQTNANGHHLLNMVMIALIALAERAPPPNEPTSRRRYESAMKRAQRALKELCEAVKDVRGGPEQAEAAINGIIDRMPGEEG